MSDPVSNHDIEDVLSSIRRLVAQGDPRKMGAGDAPKVPTPPKAVPEPVKEVVLETPEPTERLVLTPAFRVLTPETDDAETVEDATEEVAEEAVSDAEAEESSVAAFEPQAPQEWSHPLSERASLEAKIAALEAAVSGDSDDFEPDGSEVVAKPTFGTTFLGARDVPAEESATDTETSVNSAVVDHIASTVADEIAGAFPHLNAAEPAVKDDQTVVPLKPDMHVAPAAPEAAQADASPVTPVETPDEEVVVVAPKIHKPAAFRVAPDAAPETADVAAPDTVTEEAAAVAEPEVEVVAPVSPEAPTFRHSAREVYDPVAEATADAAEAAADGDDIYGDELAPDPGTAVAEQVAPAALMDPDMVRDMVSQMIREELQGEMGERITRNVRKLVRREINRVLSAQEFD